LLQILQRSAWVCRYQGWRRGCDEQAAAWKGHDPGAVLLIRPFVLVDPLTVDRGALAAVVPPSTHRSSRHTIPAQRHLEMSPAARVLSENGRGLMIVGRCPTTAVTANGISKQLWFRRPVAADWPYNRGLHLPRPGGASPALRRAAVAVPVPAITEPGGTTAVRLDPPGASTARADDGREGGRVRTTVVGPIRWDIPPSTG
jgi:hypothetical protein